MSNLDFDDTRRQIRRKLGLEVYFATLGDANGIVQEPNRPGYCRVRYTTAAGLSLPPVVKLRAVVPMNPGLPVVVSYDERGDLAIIAGDFDGLVASGSNPFILNPADRNVYGFTGQTQIVTALSHAVSTSNTPSTDVAVRSWIYLQEDTWYYFPGERVPLASFIPAAGLQCLAGLYLKDDLTIEVLASTDKDLLDPLGLDDVQEIHDAATAGSIPIWFWRLADDQSEVTDVDSFLDGRQFLNTITSSTGGAVTADDVDYSPLVPSDWLTPPTNAAEAFDELAYHINNLQAGEIDYTPGTPSSWPFGTPSDVHEGLDLLALTSFLAYNAASIITAGRLSLHATDPIADSNGASTIYFHPFRGDKLSVYTGALWETFEFSTLSIAVPSTVVRNFDVFAYLNGTDIDLEVANWDAPLGAIAITSITNASPPVASTANTTGLVAGQLVVITGNTDADNNGIWRVGTVVAGVSFQLKTMANGNPAAPGSVGTGGTYTHVETMSRTTPLVLQNGIYVKDGDPTRRYLGTGRTHHISGECADNAQKRFLWNYNNRVLRELYNPVEIANTWTYATASWRAANDNLDNRIEYVIGRQEDVVPVNVIAAAAGTSIAGAVGIGLNAITANSARYVTEFVTGATAGYRGQTSAFYKIPSEGYQCVYWLEYTRTGTVTFIGDNGAVNSQSGIQGELWG